MTDAASYELRAWDSFDRTWGAVGGVLTDTTTYTHTVQTDGRNYYYQVHARDANDIRGSWSERLYVAVVPTQFPTAPHRTSDMICTIRKYMDVSGVTVAAPSVVSDEQMIRSREIISGMLANRSDLLEALAANNTEILLRDDFIGIAQPWFAYMPANDPHCVTFIHEFAHVIHHAIRSQAAGNQFDTRLYDLYQTAVNAGLCPAITPQRDPRNTGLIQSDSGFRPGTGRLNPYRPFWRRPIPSWQIYDPEIAKLIEEVFGDATVPSACMR